MPKNSLIDDGPYPSQPTKRVAAKNADGTVKKSSGSNTDSRRLSIPSLLSTNNKSNSRKERKNLLGRLSEDLEYLEGLLQVIYFLYIICTDV